MFKVMIVFGTRPEAIKMAPIVRQIKKDLRFEVVVCVTGQHREMLIQVLRAFEIKVDENLELMRDAQTINSLTGAIVTGMDFLYEKHLPDVVLVHGDTTTCFAGALAAFHRGIPVGHVEAGLRTGNLKAPWPEEANRCLTSVITDLHFAPTPRAKENLLQEGICEKRVFVTGNTVIDALLWMRNHLETSGWEPTEDVGVSAHPERRMVLITGHRRESFGEGFGAICRAIEKLADRYQDVDFVYPVHLNPSVRAPVYKLLSGKPNIHLIEPLDYQHFVWAMARSFFIITDSGGIQEEAPSLGRPVLVMRDSTERPEAIEAGAIRLVGVTEESIYESSCLLLDNQEAYNEMVCEKNPFGNGRASEKIIEHLAGWLLNRS